MTPWTVALLLAIAGALAGVPSPAAAQDDCGDATGCAVPQCNENHIDARPGIERAYRLNCWPKDSFSLAEGPQHGTLTELHDEWGTITWHYRADDDAPRDDAFVLEVKGPNGTIHHRIDVTITPLDVNTPPKCDPVEIAERTLGLAPVELGFFVQCWDDQGDAFTIDGGGPGEHLDAPRDVPSQHGNTPWRYRTATSDGAESTTYWATDDVGARGAEAPISVEVGTGVDRLPTCGPNPSYGYEPNPVYARPGDIRRFTVICADPDGDPFVPAVSEPPSHGVMTLVPGAPSSSWSGALETFSGATYVPTPGDTPQEDPFSVTATGPKGAGPPAKMTIVPRALPENGGGGCGWSGGGRTAPGVPLPLWAGCGDDDGDELTAEIWRAPEHGVATPPVVTPGLTDGQIINFAYTPALGFGGWDCVGIRVSDGHGLSFELLYQVFVEAPVDVPPIDLPPVDPPDLPEVDPPLDNATPPSDDAAPPPSDDPTPSEPSDDSSPPSDPADDSTPSEPSDDSTPPPSDPSDDSTPPPSDPADDSTPSDPADGSTPSEPSDDSTPPPSDESTPAPGDESAPLPGDDLPDDAPLSTAPTTDATAPLWTFPQPPVKTESAPPLVTTVTGGRGASAVTAPAAPAGAPAAAGPPVATRAPSVGQAPPIAPADQARRALHVRRVRLVKRIGDARLYAPRRGRRAVAISCPLACTVRAQRRKLSVTPGRAGVLRVPRRGLRLSLSDVRGPAGRATIRLR
ncbi:MAG TPA: hypothetical protein VF549_02520 [Solirubrobacteraceae bacterium]|jgi:hypothetical protein